MEPHRIVGEFYHNLLSKTTRSLLIYSLMNPHSLFRVRPTHCSLINEVIVPVMQRVLQHLGICVFFKKLQLVPPDAAVNLFCAKPELYIWAPQPQRITSTKRSDSKSQQPF